MPKEIVKELQREVLARQKTLADGLLEQIQEFELYLDQMKAGAYDDSYEMIEARMHIAREVARFSEAARRFSATTHQVGLRTQRCFCIIEGHWSTCPIVGDSLHRVAGR